MTTTANHGIDQALFRSPVGHYASGIAIITGRNDHGLIGFTCQSFRNVPVDPPAYLLQRHEDLNHPPKLPPE
jgi:flavin reductase (DIM6/NTAB) family NADH-FMN oxidoreductase RutF